MDANGTKQTTVSVPVEWPFLCFHCIQLTDGLVLVDSPATLAFVDANSND